MTLVVTTKIDGVFGSTNDREGVRLAVGDNAITPAQLELLNESRQFQQLRKNGYITVTDKPDSGEEENSDSAADKKSKKTAKPKD